MSRSIIAKLHWRLSFALGGEPPVVRELIGHNPFPLRERLAFLNPFTRRPSRDELLLRSRRRDSDGGEYFLLGGNRIYFRPSFPVPDDAALLDATRLILKEAYLKDEHFSPPEVCIRPGDTVLDLGGHIGTSALTYSRHTGPTGRVFSFEPLVHELLERNIRANNASNVRVVPLGVWEEPGEAEFRVRHMLINSSVAPASAGTIRVQTIRMTTIDEFVDSERLDRVDFIKMDIEGAEGPALRGATRTVERFRPAWSVASYHTDPCGSPQHPMLVNAFRELGYRIKEVKEGSRGMRIFAW